MRCLLVSFTVLVTTVLALNIVPSNGMNQERLEHTLPPHLAPKGESDKASRGHHNRGVGDPCSSNSDCQRKLCCVSKGVQRTCQPLSQRSKPCTNSQVKGNYYYGSCPCAEGNCGAGGVCPYM
ncbi:hypothetical protein V5799_002738 [Amblyomma americanum]|uniref:Ixodegrin B n=1 Tax=Amblyomma americanum TaxID=6943 RepID=A0AAQ4DAZ0_AMBAM